MKRDAIKRITACSSSIPLDVRTVVSVLATPLEAFKVSKGAKIRNQYNQVLHLTQDTNGNVTNSQLYTTNESQEVSPFQAGDRKAQINRRTQRHNQHMIRGLFKYECK